MEKDPKKSVYNASIICHLSGSVYVIKKNDIIKFLNNNPGIKVLF